MFMLFLDMIINIMYNMFSGVGGVMESFVKVNMELPKAMDELTKKEVRVLLHLGVIMGYDNRILWEDDLRNEISESLGYARRNFENCISKLIKKKFIFRKGFYLYISDKYLKKGR